MPHLIPPQFFIAKINGTTKNVDGREDVCQHLTAERQLAKLNVFASRKCLSRILTVFIEQIGTILVSKFEPH